MPSQNLNHAYQQAPWRLRAQKLGSLLSILIAFFIIGSLYLNISTKVAETGIEIQRLEQEKEIRLRNITSLKTEIAFQTSSKNMEERAKALGFESYKPGDAAYLVVSGYTGRSTAQLAPPTSATLSRLPLIKPSYTQSLWEWLTMKMVELNNVRIGE
jgi:hypothetical protein